MRKINKRREREGGGREGEKERDRRRRESVIVSNCFKIQYIYFI